MLVADLQQLKDSKPMTTATYTTSGNDFMAFIQTADMLELYKRNGDETGGGVLITLVTSREVPSRYGCGVMYLSGVDREIGNIITFGIGLVSEISKASIWWCFN